MCSSWVTFTLIFSVLGCGAPEPGIIDMPLNTRNLERVTVQPEQGGLFSKQIEYITCARGISIAQSISTLVEVELLSRLAEKDTFLETISPRVPQVLAQRWLDLEVEQQLRRSKIDDDFLRSVYRRNLDRYQRPPQSELNVVAIFTGARMKPEPRQRRLEFAKEIQNALLGSQTPEDFAGIATRPEWREKHVVFARVFQGPNTPFPATVWNEARKLKKIGQATSLIRDIDGFFIAQYLGERPAINIPFEDVKAFIIANSFEKWRQDRFQEISNNILRRHAVQIFESRPTKK